MEIEDYEIERISNRVVSWYPSLKFEGVKMIIDYSLLSLKFVLIYVKDLETIKKTINGIYDYCIDSIDGFSDVKMTLDHKKWIGEEIKDLFFLMTKQ